MTLHTEHYGFHQWEPEDNFLREDFNEDFKKMDTALDRVEQGTITNGYNVYNLMLQQDYEGKYTGYKKALLFDGFVDDSRIESRSPALLVRDNSAKLYRVGEDSWSQAKGSSANSPYNATLSTGTHTAAGAGLVTALTFYITETGSSGTNCTLQIEHNGTVVQEQSFSVSNSTTGAKKITLVEPLSVLPGDQYQFLIPKDRTLSPSLCFALSTTSTLAVDVDVTSAGADSATLTVTPQPELSYQQARLWLRHAGGSVTPTLNGVPMTPAETEETTELLGSPCTQHGWTAPGGEGVALALTLECGEDESCILYDYGLLLS